jgi:hypothetical protein
LIYIGFSIVGPPMIILLIWNFGSESQKDRIRRARPERYRDLPWKVSLFILGLVVIFGTLLILWVVRSSGVLDMP